MQWVSCKSYLYALSQFHVRHPLLNGGHHIHHGIFARQPDVPPWQSDKNKNLSNLNGKVFAANMQCKRIEKKMLNNPLFTN